MKRPIARQLLCLTVLALLCGRVGPANADTRTVTGTIRDFRASHPDMENGLGVDPGIVLPDLGADQKPVYAGQAGNPTTHGQVAFDQWYRDVPGINLSQPLSLTLDNTITPDPSIFTFSDSSFFPIDGQLFGNEGNAHNYHFTFELHTRFTYQGGEIFTFTGDDDLWVFINGKLAIDLGGVHPAITGSVDLDAAAAALGIVAGNTYDFDLFFAERHLVASNFRIDTSIEFDPTGTITIVKDVVGDSPLTDWQFSGDLGSFTLPAAGGQMTFQDVPVGTYAVTEDDPGPDFALTGLMCDDPDNGSDVDFDTRTATIDLDSSETVTCTYENTMELPEADLEVTMNDAVDPVTVGDDVVYTVTVHNNGPDPAENVVVTDTLPAGVTYESATPDQGDCTESGGVVTCELGSVANGASVDIVIVVRTTTAGTLTNTASVVSDTIDPNGANNSTTEQTTVTPEPIVEADLQVMKDDAADPVTVGDDVTYTVTVSNNGPDAAQNVVMTDILPAGVTFVSATPTQGSCSEASGEVTCNLGTMASGASVTITIVITTTAEGTLTNTASVATDTTDPTPGNDSATEDTTVEPVEPPRCPDDLVISHYQTEPRNEQVVEIANVGREPISLDGCSLRTYDARAETLIKDASAELSGMLDPGETFLVGSAGVSGVDAVIPDGILPEPGAFGIYNGPLPADGSPFDRTPADITGMTYFHNTMMFGVAHNAVPAHNAVYDCIYGGHGPGTPPDFYQKPFQPLSSCFP